MVENIKNLLQREGIDCQLRNQYASGGLGEIAPIDTWPELFVDEAHRAAAENIIQTVLAETNEASWYCSECGEENDSSFEICWQCQTERRE